MNQTDETGHAPRMLRYGLVGLIATATHYCLMAALIVVQMSAVTASSAGAVVGALVAYALNRKWTFKRRHQRRQLLRFMAVALLGVLLNGMLLLAMLRMVSDSVIVAQGLSTAGVFLATYFINLRWSFA